MTPYYEDEQVTLYHGDCREVAAWLEADVLVTDPPYGIDYRTNARRTEGGLARSIEGDKDTRMRDAALGFWRRHNGDDAPALVFGTWRVKRPHRTRQLLIWDTKGALGMGATDLPWMAGLIRKCPPGVVADPFAGSGSTLLAAKREQRRAIGVELDERYCEIAAKRLAVAQDTLFGGVA